jgi:hypothetical protein
MRNIISWDAADAATGALALVFLSALHAHVSCEYIRCRERNKNK